VYVRYQIRVNCAESRTFSVFLDISNIGNRNGTPAAIRTAKQTKRREKAKITITNSELFTVHIRVRHLTPRDHSMFLCTPDL
jgi:hypothetical protein